MQGTLVLRFKSSAVRTVFLPMAISSVRAKPRSRPVATPLAAERDPRKVFTGTVGTWGLLNHGKLGSANDEGSHLRIILNHCI